MSPRGYRVLLVIDSLQIGGAERYVVDLAAALQRAGDEPAVACSVAGPLAAELQRCAVPVHALCDKLAKRRFRPRYAHALRGLLAAETFDVVHAHLYASALAAAAALPGAGTAPLVITDHTEGPWRGAGARAASCWAYRRAAHVVAVSPPIRRVLTERFDVPPERVTYVPTAIRAGARQRPARADGRVIIGRACRLQPEKGIDVLLRAAAQLARRFPHAEFAIVGDGPLRGELERLAASLGLGRRVRFLGELPDARGVIAALDVLVVCSITDGSPLVVLEAMAAGVPVVGSAVGGIPAQVRHERDGLLVPPGDAAALAAALGRLIDDEALRRRLGAEALRQAARRFSHDALVARMRRIYGVAAAAGRRAVPPPRLARRA